MGAKVPEGQGEAFQLALIRDPRFPRFVNDIVMEFGNSKYQPVLDRASRSAAPGTC